MIYYFSITKGTKRGGTQNMKYYSKGHQWVKLDGDDAIVGITAFAANERSKRC